MKTGDAGRETTPVSSYRCRPATTGPGAVALRQAAAVSIAAFKVALGRMMATSLA
jgi:hypothetical protein